jgi:spore photoproduct lyase
VVFESAGYQAIRRAYGCAGRGDGLKLRAEAVQTRFYGRFSFRPDHRYPDWEKHYEALIDELYENIDPARIAWISLGSLRFPPSMKDKIIERYPQSKIPYGELIRGQDQKMRYFRLRADSILRSYLSEIK